MNVSRFTVVQTYDRLVAQGLIQSRRGAGYYVCARTTPVLGAEEPTRGDTVQTVFDTSFLLRNILRETTGTELPSSAGLLPADWMDADMVGAALRAVGRNTGAQLLGYGSAKGYLPLRQQIASVLQMQDVPAHPAHHVMTVAGVTQGLDVILRALVQPGDTVLVEDPAWFLVFARLRALGANVVGVPRLADGPDVVALQHIAQRHRPTLFIVNTAVHNPTGFSLSAGVAHEVLKIAEQFDFMLVEDDTYADFYPTTPVRLAALDRLKRVMLVGGYSKTLAASLRVGYIAAAPALIEKLTDIKLLGALTSPELNERVVHRVLVDGNYKRHVERLRARVETARDRCLKALGKLDCVVHTPPTAGMFVWADCGVDTEIVAQHAAAQGEILAPGFLFSPQQTPSTFIRVSVSAVENKAIWPLLSNILGHLRAGRRTP